MLGSRSWVKAISDKRHAAELRRFGVPNVLELAPAAPELPADEPQSIGDNGAPQVMFIGDALPTSSADSNPTPDWLSALLNHVLAGVETRSFFELYFRRNPLAAPIRPADERSMQLAKLRDYFTARHFFVQSLARRRRDTWLRRLGNTLGERCLFLGSGWEGLGVPQPTISSLGSLVQLIQDVSVHVVFPACESECDVDHRLFTIAAAGGFVLAWDHPELRELFVPGEECVTFRSEEELLAAVEHYSARPDERLRIARNGQRRARECHRHEHRLRAIISHMVCAVQTTDSHAASARTPSQSPKCPPSVRVSTALSKPRVVDPSPSLLFLLNPGDFSRHYLTGMMAAASQLGWRVSAPELDPIWRTNHTEMKPDGQDLTRTLREQNVRAVIGSSLNGLLEWPTSTMPDGRRCGFFERRGVKQLMWWTDHPHWASERIGLREDLQDLLRSPNNHHFVKSPVAARELREVLSWANCHGVPVAEDPEQLRPAANVDIEHDVVAIVGSPPRFVDEISPFLDDDDPDPVAIARAVAPIVQRKLTDIWNTTAPVDLRPALGRLSLRWIDAKARERWAGSHRLLHRLMVNEPGAVEWLLATPRAYFPAVEAMWDLAHWERTFTLMYLARRFRVGVYGSDWSGAGFSCTERVAHVDQPSIYARGVVAINVSQGNDEEGLSHKPFQMAACGMPMIHQQVNGLGDCFTPGSEVLTFSRPAEAREAVARLIRNRPFRGQLARGARERLLRDHTWRERLAHMLELAGISQHPTNDHSADTGGSKEKSPSRGDAVVAATAR